MTATDTQLVQLISQAQHQQLSINKSLLQYIALHLPIPTSWQLGMYHFLTALPLPELSPMWFTILVTVSPILLIILSYVFIVMLLKLTRFLMPFVLKRIVKVKEEEKVFLELTFPADTSKSAYATQQLYTLLHTLARQKTFLESVLKEKKTYSLEIVATKTEGIRYILVTNPKHADVLKRSLLSYLPGIKIKENTDYLEQTFNKDMMLGLTELKLASHFALPLSKQKVLDEHDIIAYLTGNMTKLKEGEMISFQLVTTPVLASVHGSLLSKMQQLRYKMRKGEPITPIVQQNPLDSFLSLPGISLLWVCINGLLQVFSFSVMFVTSMAIAAVDTQGKNVPFFQSKPTVVPQEILNPYEQDLQKVVREKIDQHLFESSIRVFLATKDTENMDVRLSGLLAAFGPLTSPYQTFATKGGLPWFSSFQRRFKQLKERTLSFSSSLQPNPILSTSEISDLYHFPYTDTTKTEDIVKVHSKDLPAPLSLKQGQDFDVVFGMNTYGGETTAIGLTDDDRSRHVYLLGQTGSGKSTIIFHMAKDDIAKGRGIALIDPHGDLAEDVLATVPIERINDVVYVNPFDLKYPVGINLLELTPGLDEDELELEKELVCESIVSIFRRVFSNEEHSNAHRIEYILRNTIYTAFTVKDATLFTIYDLLNNPDFQKEVIKKLEDQNLKNFWKYEFGRAGNFQLVKMVSGVTAKVGRFLFSPTAKRILEQKQSTIHFDDILDQGKILICNLSEGKLGEDTTQLLGTTLMTKIQQTALRRARTNLMNRTPFYLFVDEFQTFATSSFTRLLSGGRKFGLRITIAEQSTAQQEERRIVNVILANTATMICFRTASPIDEQLMAQQFAPYISKTDVANLPRYHFYMKMSALAPEEPFSGKTLPMTIEKDEKTLERLIEASRKNYAIVYQKPAPKKQIAGRKETKQPEKEKEKLTKKHAALKNLLPEDEDEA